MPVLICLRKELWTGLISVGDQVPTCPVFTRAKIKSRLGILVNLPSHWSTASMLTSLPLQPKQSNPMADSKWPCHSLSPQPYNHTINQPATQFKHIPRHTVDAKLITDRLYRLPHTISDNLSYQPFILWFTVIQPFKKARMTKEGPILRLGSRDSTQAWNQIP